MVNVVEETGEMNYLFFLFLGKISTKQFFLFWFPFLGKNSSRRLISSTGEHPKAQTIKLQESYTWLSPPVICLGPV